MGVWGIGGARRGQCGGGRGKGGKVEELKWWEGDKGVRGYGGKGKRKRGKREMRNGCRGYRE